MIFTWTIEVWFDIMQCQLWCRQWCQKILGLGGRLCHFLLLLRCPMKTHLAFWCTRLARFCSFKSLRCWSKNWFRYTMLEVLFLTHTISSSTFKPCLLSLRQQSLEIDQHTLLATMHHSRMRTSHTLFEQKCTRHGQWNLSLSLTWRNCVRDFNTCDEQECLLQLIYVWIYINF